MVNLQKSGDRAVKFVFTDSDHYLYGNGEIEVPVNSLLLVIDESEMVTFKKLSGDPFLSFRADNSNLGTKEAIEQFYKENMVGSTGGGSESGITSGEVQTMIDESISGKASISDVTAVNDALTAHTANTSIHVTSAEKTTWNNKSDFSGDYNDLTNKPTIPTVPTNISDFTNDAGYITNADITGKADTTAVTQVNDALTAHTANTTVHVSQAEKDIWNAKVDSSAITTSITSGSTDSEIPTAKAVYDATQSGGGGMDDDTQQLISTAFNDLNDRKADLTELSKYQKKGDYVKTSTLADYKTNASFDEYATAKERIISGALNDLDNRVTAVESGGSVTVDTTLDSGSTNPVQNAVITQALNAKADTSAITTSITSGSTDAEIPTAKATYDAIQAGGGGGATYSAGTNISIANDTINCTLPITANTNNLTIGSNSFVTNTTYGSISFGKNSHANAYRSLAGGEGSNVSIAATNGFAWGNGANVNIDSNASGAATIGYHTKSSIRRAFTTGSYNSIADARTGENFGSSGNTLFAVGNGTSEQTRHNAFEIRQNGDIYVNDGTNDVRLQDTILALGGLKLVKLTQAEYYALATKDSSTLYIISD